MRRLVLCCVSTSILLLLPFQATACPPRPIGLEALIERSDQAILVEIVAVERSQERLAELMTWLRTAVRNGATNISADLRWWLDTVLPEERSDGAVAVATAVVYDHLAPDGPQIGSTFRWDVKHPVVPGHHALIFLDKNSRPWIVHDLAVLDVPDAVLLLPEDVESVDLSEVIRQGYNNKRRGGVATSAWLEAAIRSSESRPHLANDHLVDRVSPGLVANALLDQPTGAWIDVDLLRQLDSFPHAGLDLIALEWVEIELETGNEWAVRRAMEIAAARWGLWLVGQPCTGVDDLRTYWAAIAEAAGLPRPGPSQL